MACQLLTWHALEQLLVGAAGGAVSMFAIAAYNNIEDPANNPTSSLPPGGKAAMFFFYLWTAFYAVSWNVSITSSTPALKQAVC